MKDKKDFAREIESIALRSLIYEVSTTPKPGLVDRSNNGAHNDMDFFTFVDSSCVLGESFYCCATAGIEHDGDINTLLKEIRPMGLRGEKKMFSITNDVNTHKGLVFSLGILCAAIGYLYQKKTNYDWTVENICNLVGCMTKGLVNRELESKEFNRVLTYGEKLYMKYGTTGIRGEVASGFKTVREYGLPVFKKLMEFQKGSLNDRMVQVLMHLMAHCEDSNILGRHNMEMLQRVQTYAREIIQIGGVFSEEGMRAIREFDKWCIKHWVSPGGSADLLAVTIMLYFSERLNEEVIN